MSMNAIPGKTHYVVQHVFTCKHKFDAMDEVQWDIGFGFTIVKASIYVLSRILVEKWNVLNLSDKITMTWFE